MNGYEPFQSAFGKWWWHNCPLDPMPGPWTLPPKLFEALPPGCYTRNSLAMAYPTRQAALQALAVAVGRAEKQ